MSQKMSTDDLCGRRGCSKAVANGMQCQYCNKWFHANCTGLTEVQYGNLDNNSVPFSCMACRVDVDNVHVAPTKQDASTATQALETCTVEYTITFLRDTILNMQKEASERHDQLMDEIRRIKLSLPTHAAAEKALELSKQAIIDASNDLTDHIKRETRVIFWGSFSKDIDVNLISSSILSYAFNNSNQPTFTAHRLFSKKSVVTKGILVTLPSKEHASKTLERAAELKKAFPFVTGIAPDRPLKLRRDYQGKHAPFTDKLLLSPRVLLTPLPQPTLENLPQEVCTANGRNLAPNDPDVTMADCTTEDEDYQPDMEICSGEELSKTRPSKTPKQKAAKTVKSPPNHVGTSNIHTPTRQAPRLQPRTCSVWSLPTRVRSTASVFHPPRLSKPPNIYCPVLNRVPHFASTAVQQKFAWRGMSPHLRPTLPRTHQTAWTTDSHYKQRPTHKPPHYPTKALLPTPTPRQRPPHQVIAPPLLQGAPYTRRAPTHAKILYNQWSRPLTNWPSGAYTQTA